jgi:hypothetical protein
METCVAELDAALAAVGEEMFRAQRWL